MKKILLLSSLVCAMFAADGATLFKTCIACHGQHAEKSYLNKVPVLTTLTVDERVEFMKAYKAGERNEYKMGAVMKASMAKLTEEDMKAVSEFIETLK